MATILFFLTLLILIILFWRLDVKYQLFRDISSFGDKKCKSFSYSRVQLGWWTIIIITCFVTVLVISLISGTTPPVLDNSILILLGIGAGTTTTANIIDVSDNKNNKPRYQDQKGGNFIYDILNDGQGVSIPRLQSVIFNIIIGIYMLSVVYSDMNKIPKLDSSWLILLGISSGTYLAMKSNENNIKPG